MKKWFAALALVSVSLLTGCGSVNQPVNEPLVDVARPGNQEATVIFYRDSFLGNAVASPISVADADQKEDLVGVPSYNNLVVYKAQPGKTTFAVGGESQNGMTANLEADKVYVANVDPHMGLWKASFSLDPVEITQKLVKLLKGLAIVETKPDQRDRLKNAMHEKMVNVLKGDTRRDITTMPAHFGMLYEEFKAMLNAQ